MAHADLFPFGLGACDIALDGHKVNLTLLYCSCSPAVTHVFNFADAKNDFSDPELEFKKKNVVLMCDLSVKSFQGYALCLHREVF